MSPGIVSVDEFPPKYLRLTTRYKPGTHAREKVLARFRKLELAKHRKLTNFMASCARVT